MSSLCFLCSRDGSLTCQRCQSITACSTYHLGFHSHQSICFPFQIIEKPLVGRCVVASRDIDPGELLLFDSTSVYGPRVGEEEIEIDDGIRIPQRLQAQFILIRRRAMDRDFFQLTELLIHHDRNGDDSSALLNKLSYIIEKTNSCPSPLQDITKCSGSEVDRCQSLLDINALSLQSSNNRGFFPIFSFLSHSCENNTRHVTRKKGNIYEVRLYSQRKILVGEELTITYTNLLRPTYRRQAHLSNVWKFVCTCKRCKDPSEKKSFISGVICPHCNDGTLLPESESSKWICETCSKTLAQSDVEKMVDSLEGVLNETPKEVSEIQNYLKMVEPLLHPNHYLRLLAKRLLMQLLPLDPKSGTLKERKSLCEELLEIFNNLDGGISASRGATLFELGRTQLAQGNLPEAIGSLKNAENCLKFEEGDEGLQGRMLKQIRQTLRVI